MSKRPSKRVVSVPPLHERLAEIGATAIAAEDPPSRRPLPLSLDDIRVQALKEHANTAHTIADLEAWRSEIDATIAFLRSQR